MASTVSFPSMGRAPRQRGGAAKLVSVKAASQDYPLRGQVIVAARADAAPRRLFAESLTPAAAAAPRWPPPRWCEQERLGLGPAGLSLHSGR